MRSRLLKASLSAHIMNALTPRKRKTLAKALDEFKNLITDKKTFKKFHHATFMEGIEFVYEIMRGSYEFADLSSIEQQLVIALKEKSNLFTDMKAKNSPVRALTILFARIIHQRLFALLRTSEGGQLPSNTVRDLVDELVDRLQAKGFVKWLESQVNVNVLKRERRNLRAVRCLLRFDWLQRESISDHLTNVAHVIHALLVNEDGQFAKKGLGRIILQDLAISDLFRNDPAFSPNEKLNLTIVFARMIRARVDAIYPPIKDNGSTQALPRAIGKETAKKIIGGLSKELDINPDFLKRFYNFLLDKYQITMSKLQEKVSLDPIYRKSFQRFISELVNTVFDLTRNPLKLSKLTPFRLRIQEDLELYPYDWRRPNPVLFTPQEKKEPSPAMKEQENHEEEEEQDDTPELQEIPELPEPPSKPSEGGQDIFTREISDDDPLWRVRAYIIGFLLADGTIRTNPYEVAAAQNSKDKDILYKINKALGGKVQGPDDEDKYHLNVYQKDLVLKLKEFGMKEAHSTRSIAKNLIPPSFIQKVIGDKSLVRDFTRGFYEGDGWITGSFKRGDTSFRILGPLKFLKYLKELISNEISEISSFIVAERKQYFIQDGIKHLLYSKQKIYIKGQGFYKLTQKDLENGEIVIQDHPWLKILIFAGNYNCTRFFDWMYDNDDDFDKKAIQGIRICGDGKFRKALDILGDSKERKERLAPDWKDCLVDSILHLQKKFYSAKEIMNLTNVVLKKKLDNLGLNNIYKKQSAKNLDKFRDRLKFHEFLDNTIGHYRKGNRNLYYSEFNKPVNIPSDCKKYIDLVSNSKINENIKSLIIYYLIKKSTQSFKEIYKTLRTSGIFSKNVLYLKNVKLNLAELVTFNIIIVDDIELELEEQQFEINKKGLSRLLGKNIDEIQTELDKMYKNYNKNNKNKK